MIKVTFIIGGPGMPKFSIADKLKDDHTAIKEVKNIFTAKHIIKLSKFDLILVSSSLNKITITKMIRELRKEIDLEKVITISVS